MVAGSDSDYLCSSPLRVYDRPGLQIVGAQLEEEVPNDPHAPQTNTGMRFMWNGPKAKTMLEMAGCAALSIRDLNLNGNNLVETGVVFRGRNKDGGARAVNAEVTGLSVFNCLTSCVQVGDSESQQWDTTTFRNLFCANAGMAALHLLGGNTQCISFIGGSAADSPVGVQVDDGGAVFTDFTTIDISNAHYEILGSPQGGLSLNKCYGEAKDGSIYFRTATDSPGTGDRPVVLSNCIAFIKDANGHSILHRNSQVRIFA